MADVQSLVVVMIAMAYHAAMMDGMVTMVNYCPAHNYPVVRPVPLGGGVYTNCGLNLGIRGMDAAKTEQRNKGGY